MTARGRSLSPVDMPGSGAHPYTVPSAGPRVIVNGLMDYRSGHSCKARDFVKNQDMDNWGIR